MDTLSNESDLAQHFDTALQCVADRYFKLFWNFIPYASERQLKQSQAKINRYIDNLIELRIHDPTISDREDFLSLNLKNLKSNEIDRIAIRDSCLNMLLASRDTTSQLLTWTIRELALNLDHQDRLRREVETAFGADSKIEYSMIKSGKLPFLRALLCETLRLWPPVCANQKDVVRDCVLPSGQKMKRGDVFEWYTYATGRDEKYYVQPDQYLPQRWLEQSAFAANDDPNLAIPFASFHLGPRTCLGQRQALLQANIVLASLMLAGYEFSFTPEERERTLSQVPYTLSLTIRCKPYFVKVSKHQSNK